MIGDIVKEMRRQLVGERKAVTGLPLGAGTYTQRPSIDFATLSKDGYEKNALIFDCINELASSASEAKCIVEKKNRKDEWEAWPQSRLQRLLDKPNPLMSGYEFWFHVILYKSLAGNCLWEKEPSRAGLTVGLWLMRPDYVRVKAVEVPIGQRTRKKIEAYEWQAGAESVWLPVDSVIHFKHPHPRDELWGFPPLAAAARQGDTDNFATDYVQSFFKNAAVPFGILKTKGVIDQDERSRAEEFLNTMYGYGGGIGDPRWHRPLILGDDASWEQMGQSMQDMDFPQLRMITETRICGVFQVPPILVGSYAGTIGTTYANYQEARKSFWQETLMPIYREHADTINLQLTPEFGKDLRVRFDFSAVSALQEDKDKAWVRATSAFSASMITRNMALKEIGEEPVDGGDIFLQPLMMVPVPIGEEPIVPGAKGMELKSAIIPEEAKERWAKAIDLVAQSYESIFKKTARGLFKAEKEALLKILRKEGKATKAGAPYATFLVFAAAYLAGNKDEWVDEFQPLFAALVAAQGENILAAYGISFDIARPEVQEFLQNYTMKFAQGLFKNSEEKLKAVIMQAQAEGWSVPTTRNSIMELWDGFDKNRADMIARTETIRSSNAGAQEAWRQAGIEKKQWYTTLDGRQCGWCESMHEKVVSMTSTFVGAGQLVVGDKTLDLITPTEYPPLHPRCRCTILAYFEEL